MSEKIFTCMQEVPNLNKNYSSGAIIWGSVHPIEEIILLLNNIVCTTIQQWDVPKHISLFTFPTCNWFLPWTEATIRSSTMFMSAQSLDSVCSVKTGLWERPDVWSVRRCRKNWWDGSMVGKPSDYLPGLTGWRCTISRAEHCQELENNAHICNTVKHCTILYQNYTSLLNTGCVLTEDETLGKSKTRCPRLRHHCSTVQAKIVATI